MGQFQAFSPQVEVNGETVYSIIDGMGSFKSRSMKILVKNGIENPQPGQWYKQQDWLNAFKEIAETIGDKTLFLIGLKIPENAKFPPEINNPEKALAAIDMAYHINHRKGEIGYYKFEKAGPRSGKMICKNPYPCTFDRGIIEAMLKKFPVAGGAASVVHDDKAPCRKKGADSCTYIVKW